MGNVMAYSGIVTKVHGMQAKLLSEEELEEVAFKKTVPEVIEYLKERPAYEPAGGKTLSSKEC